MSLSRTLLTCDVGRRSGFYSPAPAALLLRGGEGRPQHHGGPSSPPHPHPPLPPKVEAPSSWSWLRGKQSRPSFSPFQPSSHLRQAPCPKLGAWKSSLGRGPRPPCLLLPPCRGAGGGAVLGGALCYKLHKDFSQTTIQGFLSCRVGRQRLPALPRILLWIKHFGGAGNVCSICWLPGAPPAPP